MYTPDICDRIRSKLLLHLALGPRWRRPERLVGAIVRLMEEDRETTQSLGGREADEDAMGDKDSESGTTTLCKKMHEISVSRQRKAGVLNKAKWVVSSKEKLSGLFESIEKLITNLENLFSPPVKAELANLCNQEALQLRNEAVLSLLEGEAKRFDQMLARAIAKQKAVSWVPPVAENARR